MYSKFMKLCSLFLSLVMIFQLLPAHVFGAEEQITAPMEEQTTNTSSVSTSIQTSQENIEASLEDATIVMEVVENRTEFSKEYKLSNGMHMAIVYAETVHYEEDGQWKDIDNTLKADGKGNMITTAGNWYAQFPEQIGNNAEVVISKDGYSVSFSMEGQLYRLSLSDNDTVTPIGLGTQEQTVTVQAAQQVTGQVAALD